MNIKGFLSVALFLATVMSANAQKGVDNGTQFGSGEDSIRCLTNISLFIPYAKVNNFQDAYPYWKIAYDECPAATKDIYLYGVRIMNWKIAQEKDPAKQAALIDEQVTVSDLKTINGKKYAFDQDGKMLYGWIDKDSNTIKTGDDAWVDADYYFGGWNDGSAQNGWVQLTVNTDSVRSGDGDGSDTFWFYFDNNGKKQSNKKKNINGYTFYFDKYGRMIEDWSTATKNGADGFDTPANATDSIVYTNADGAARKNQWVWAVPSEDYDKDDYDDDSYSWWWAQGNGKIFKDGIRKIKGKSYAFDEKGRMLSGIVGVVDGHYTNKYNGKDKWLDLSKDAYLDQAASLGADQKLYYFSSDEKKDGSRKSGYQNVEFDDDSYQMYFKTNGEAENNYVSKIKKYVAYGVVLKADNEESNLAGVQVDSANRKKLVGRNVEYYGTANIADGNHVLVNAAGAVQEKKTNVKDSNDVYYLTDKDGVILYAGDKKTYNSKSKDHENEITLPNGKKVYTE